MARIVCLSTLVLPVVAGPAQITVFMGLSPSRDVTEGAQPLGEFLGGQTLTGADLAAEVEQQVVELADFGGHALLVVVPFDGPDHRAVPHDDSKVPEKGDPRIMGDEDEDLL